jgi:hypothetical protein
MNAHAAAIEAFINQTTRCFGAPPASVVLRRGETERPRKTSTTEFLFGRRSVMTCRAELNRGDGQAPAAVVEALMYSLRRGITELIRPDAQRRLTELAADQLVAVCLRVQAFQPEIALAWSAADADLLISAWRKFREQR